MRLIKRFVIFLYALNLCEFILFINGAFIQPPQPPIATPAHPHNSAENNYHVPPSPEPKNGENIKENSRPVIPNEITTAFIEPTINMVDGSRNEQDVKKTSNVENIVVVSNPEVPTVKPDFNTPKINQSSNDTTKALPEKPVSNRDKNIIESGALVRSLYVLLGLSLVGLAYFVYRNYRSGLAPSNIVLKYGVRTHRNDLEMAPLPINDEDEDTLYDSTLRVTKKD